MKIFFDCEFTGLHKNTTLISIGIVSEDDRTFYAEFIDYDGNQVDDWVRDNVISFLQYNGDKMRHVSNRSLSTDGKVRSYSIELSDTFGVVRGELISWLRQFDSVEFISDVCHYDMVLLVDLIGSTDDFRYCPACHDINQDISRYYGISLAEAFDKSREEILDSFNHDILGNKHNSMYDAKVIKAIYYSINS